VNDWDTDNEIELGSTDATLALHREREAFLKALDNGFAAADRGEFIEEEEMDARVEAMLRYER
jgi:predicted transcriptional regulator